MSKIFGLPIVGSDAVAPDEVVLLSETGGIRWTRDGGIEELSPYQAAQIRKAVEDAGEWPTTA